MDHFVVSWGGFVDPMGRFVTPWGARWLKTLELRRRVEDRAHRRHDRQHIVRVAVQDVDGRAAVLDDVRKMLTS